MPPKLPHRGRSRQRSNFTGPSLPAHLSQLPPATDPGLATRAQYPTEAVMSESTIAKKNSSFSILPFFPPLILLDNDPNDLSHPRLELEHKGLFESFSLVHLAWAIQRKVDPQCVKAYLDQYGVAEIKSALCAHVQVPTKHMQCPILFFAAEANSPEIVRILCKAGADPNMRILPFGAWTCLTVLSYAVLSAEYGLSDTTDTVLALLAMGACPSQIPSDLWQDYMAPPRRDAPGKAMSYFDGKAGNVNLCTTEVRHALCRSLNIMQRYTLWKAGNTPRPTPRQLQCAGAWGMLPLFEVPFHIIGQQQSTQRVQNSILSHRLFDSGTPLVFLFTGPSGHGKTELAKRMGNLLSLDMVSIDCTEMRVETDMFGPKAPYTGSAAGTPLNNFLAKWTGQRAVVFLDEFDKTTDAIGNALLLLFESGDYKDRRNHKQLDASKIIWVLAANFGVELITKFWTDNLKGRSMEQQKKAPMKTLETSLKALIIKEIGAPVTGRISEIVPFFPFNEDEQAVTAYKFMRQLWNTVRALIDTEVKWFPGHSFVTYIDDGRIAKCLAKEGYSPDVGARSLQSAVFRIVQGGLGTAFFGEAGEITNAMNDGPLANYNVHVVSLGNDISEVQVECNGTRSVQERPAEIKIEAPPTPVSQAASDDSEL